MSGQQEALRTWQDQAAATPLRAWRSAQLACLAQLLQEALSSWGKGWGLPDSWHAQVVCLPPPERIVSGWDCLGRGGTAGAWCCPLPGESTRLAQALFAHDGPVTSMLREIGQSCRRDLLARMASALQLDAGGEAGAAPPSVPSRWSGAVVAVLPWGMRLLIEYALVAKLLRSHAAENTGGKDAEAAPLVPLSSAIAPMPMPVQVHLEGRDLDIGSLQDLQPGDVLRLRHRVETPAAVLGEDGRTLFSGFLASSRGRKAVELAPAGVR